MLAERAMVDVVAMVEFWVDVREVGMAEPVVSQGAETADAWAA